MGMGSRVVVNTNTHDIMGISDAAKAQMVNLFKQKTTLTEATFRQRYGMEIEDFVGLYISEAAMGRSSGRCCICTDVSGNRLFEIWRGC